MCMQCPWGRRESGSLKWVTDCCVLPCGTGNQTSVLCKSSALCYRAVSLAPLVCISKKNSWLWITPNSAVSVFGKETCPLCEHETTSLSLPFPITLYFKTVCLINDKVQTFVEIIKYIWLLGFFSVYVGLAHFYEGRGSQCSWGPCQLCGHDCSALPSGVKAAKKNRKINEVVMVQSRFYFPQLVAAYLADGFAGRVWHTEINLKFFLSFIIFQISNFFS